MELRRITKKNMKMKNNRTTRCEEWKYQITCKNCHIAAIFVVVVVVVVVVVQAFHRCTRACEQASLNLGKCFFYWMSNHLSQNNMNNNNKIIINNNNNI